MTKVKDFQKYVKLQDQEVQNYGTMWKVLSQEIHVQYKRPERLWFLIQVMAKVQVT